MRRPSDRKPTRRQSGGAARPDPIEAFFDLHVDERQGAQRGCYPALVDEVDPQGIAVTYVFEAPNSGNHYDVAIRFAGMRSGFEGKRGPGDEFSRIERLRRLPADGGPVALTARIEGLNRGDWQVVAEPVEHDGAPETVNSLRRRVVQTHTRFGLMAQGPSVRLWSWPILVLLGALTAVILQLVLVTRAGVPASTVLGLSLAGCLLGFVGGKLWHLALHRQSLKEFRQAGACIQGFMLVSLGVLAGGALWLELPVGAVLDATTPGIFFGVAIGRPGCFLTGCCAGRPTCSRWGLVSSDRRLRIRRYPVQLLEAACGLALGVASLMLVLTVVPPVQGALFVGAIAAYTLLRQLLFPLRVESRTRRGRVITLVVCGATLLAAGGTFFS